MDNIRGDFYSLHTAQHQQPNKAVRDRDITQEKQLIRDFRENEGLSACGTQPCCETYIIVCGDVFVHLSV